MFWHGESLSRLERLCMHSFLHNGHPVDLYVYEEPRGVPPGVRLVDASEILARDLVFRHRRTGSVAPFADWFRYRLLLEKGGIWSDTDVVCLRPLDYPDPVIYARQDDRLINNAVLGLPAGHELAAWMAACCESPNRPLPYDGPATRLRKWKRRVFHGDRRDKVGWGEYGPKGFTLAARYLGYEHAALPSWHFYPVPCDEWHKLYESSAQSGFVLPQDSRAVHLWNGMAGRRQAFDKNGRFPADSPYEQLCRRYLDSEG